jgi:hypothetical protein
VQPGQGPGVGPVSLHPRLGDEAAVGWAGEGYVDAMILESVVDLDPKVPCGLKYDLDLVPRASALRYYMFMSTPYHQNENNDLA